MQCGAGSARLHVRSHLKVASGSGKRGTPTAHRTAHRARCLPLPTSRHTASGMRNFRVLCRCSRACTIGSRYIGRIAPAYRGKERLAHTDANQIRGRKAVHMVNRTKAQLSRLHHPFTDRPIRLCDVGIRPTRTRACAGCRSGGGGRAAAAGPDASSHCCPPSHSWCPGLLLLIRIELLLTPMHVLINTAAAVTVSGYRHSDSCCPTHQFGWGQRTGHNVPRAPSVGRAMADSNAMSIHLKAHPSNLLPDVGAHREHP